jgi:hypothetical protein
VIITARWVDSNGNPYDLSAAVFTIKKRSTDTTALLTVHLGSGITKEALTFWATVHLVADSLPADTYRYDFNVTRSLDGWRINLCEGELEIVRGIGT